MILTGGDKWLQLEHQWHFIYVLHVKICKTNNARVNNTSVDETVLERVNTGCVQQIFVMVM